MTHEQKLIPRVPGLIDNGSDSDRYWEIIVGTGAVWREVEDGRWSRASFPLHFLGRYVGEVRNCVATFVYTGDEMSNVSLQCSQETAVLDADQLGDIRALVPATYVPSTFSDVAEVLDDYEQAQSRRIPIARLSEIDRWHQIANHFDRDIHTNASTSLGAVLVDGTLYINPPRTRHGIYPYPDEMRHGVFSVTKSIAGVLSMFYFAEWYGEGIFDELITDYVPAFSGLPEWQGATFSYALERYVQEKEGPGVHYWDLVHENVLVPIGAAGFGLLTTRDTDPSRRVPILGLGAYPTLDEAARIARLISNEGQYGGSQLLSRNKVREALGRTGWEGYPAFSGLRYSHSFWSQTVRARGCTVRVAYMEGLGHNRILFFPSGIISFQFTDEFDRELSRLVRAVERVRSSGP